MKSKVDSVQELEDDCQPNLLCIVETHMQEEEEIAIPGYETIYQNDKTSDSVGINNNSSKIHNGNNNHASKARNRIRADIDSTK